MQDIVEQIRSPEGASTRAHAAQVLAGFVSWKKIPAIILLGIAGAAALCLRSIGSLFRRKRRRVIFKPMPGLKKGLTIKGVHLSGAAVKRGQMLMHVAAAKLWKQSKVAMLAFVWMGVGICWQALRLKPHENGLTAAPA